MIGEERRGQTAIKGRINKGNSGSAKGWKGGGRG